MAGFLAGWLGGELISWLTTGWLVCCRDCWKSGRLPLVAVAGRGKSHRAFGSTALKALNIRPDMISVDLHRKHALIAAYGISMATDEL